MINSMHKKWAQMFSGGASYGEIAAEYGVTRGAVAGAIMRYRIATGAAPRLKRAPKTPLIKQEKKIPSPPARNVPIPKARPIDKNVPQTALVAPVSSFDDVLHHNTCRYIEGQKEKGTDTYCGHARQDGKSYCPAHQALCMVKPRPYKRDHLDDLLNRHGRGA